MTIEDILDELDGMIDRAWNLPLTGGKCVIDATKCISCGTCASICPVGAITPDM